MNFDEVFDNINQGVLVVVNKNIVYANDAAALLFGYQAGAELKSQNFGVLPFIEDLKPTSYKSAAVHKNGSNFFLTVRAEDVDWLGAPAILAFLENVSDESSLHKIIADQTELLQTVLDAIPIPIYLKDTNHLFLACNSAYEKDISLNREDIIGKVVEDVRTPKTARYYRQKDEEIFANEIDQNFESQELSPNGIMQSFVLHKRLFRDAQGQVIGLVGAILDVTERKNAEHHARKNADRYELVVRGTKDGVWDWDLKTGQVHFSRRLCEIYSLGSKARNFDDQKMQEFVTPDFREHYIKTVRDYLKSDADIYEDEYRINAPSGETKWVSSHGISLRDEAGRVYRMVGSVSDVTDRVLAARALEDSEKRFRIYGEGSPAAIFMKDMELRHIYVNEKFEELFNVKKEDVIGETTAVLKHVQDVDILAESERSILHTGKTITYEFSYLRSDGREAIYKNIKFPVHNENGDVVGLGGYVEDVSERVATLSALRAAKEQAEYASRAKSEFLANMSHELRTPLNSIIGFSEIVIEEVFGPIAVPKYEEYIRDIHGSGTHLLSLINDILDMAKIEAGEVELDEQVHNIRTIVSECVPMIRERLVSQELHLSLKFESDFDAVFVDGRRLRQALINLLSNSIKFTPPNGTITVRTSENKSGGMEISITDTGIGIELDNLDDIFDPFRQARNTSSQTHEGTGLGLSLVRSLVELHGGTASIESAVGVGTTVTLSLPKERLRA